MDERTYIELLFISQLSRVLKTPWPKFKYDINKIYKMLQLREKENSFPLAQE